MYLSQRVKSKSPTLRLGVGTWQARHYQQASVLSHSESFHLHLFLQHSSVVNFLPHHQQDPGYSNKFPLCVEAPWHPGSILPSRSSHLLPLSWTSVRKPSPFPSDARHFSSLLQHLPSAPALNACSVEDTCSSPMATAVQEEGTFYSVTAGIRQHSKV